MVLQIMAAEMSDALRQLMMLSQSMTMTLTHGEVKQILMPEIENAMVAVLVLSLYS